MLFKLMKWHPVRALMGLLALVVVGGSFAPGTLTLGVWMAMLPFAAILGFAAIGQHLVIQQGGFDLSVAGIMSVSAVIVTLAPKGADTATVLLFVSMAIGSGLLAGLLSGFAIAVLGIAPIVTTIGTNALLLGAALSLSGGVPNTAPTALIEFATSRVFGISAILIVFLLVLFAVVFVVERSMIGRRFIAVGTSTNAARILAIPVLRYQLMTYVVAAFLFSIAGVLLAGYINTPTIFSGNPYMLTTVAAFVIGSNSLGREKASIPATAIGAVFLTYLDQLLVSLSFPQSIQYLTQAGIVFAGVALPVLSQRIRA
jgi:ribose/xylose/arabinose/galactoside ABC-type transport system permease subunit